MGVGTLPRALQLLGDRVRRLTPGQIDVGIPARDLQSGLRRAAKVDLRPLGGRDDLSSFLQWLDTSIAPKYGVTIQPVGIADGNQLDQATADGTFAANIYQHIHWLNEVVKSTHMKLTAVAPVFQWAYSVYSGKYKSLAALPKRRPDRSAQRSGEHRAGAVAAGARP